jgi:Bacterial toxin 4
MSNPTRTAAPSPAPQAAAKPAAPASPSSAPGIRPSGAPAVRLGEAKPGATAPGVLDLKTVSPEFKPPQEIADFLDAHKTSQVQVRLGKLAQGFLEIETRRKGHYRAKRQAIALNHPMLARAPEFLAGAQLGLILKIENNKLEGHVGMQSSKLQELSEDLISKTPEILGLFGFTFGGISLVNTLENGNLKLGIKNVPVKLGSAFSGKLSIEAVDENVSFNASAKANIKGLASGDLELQRNLEGIITGKVKLALAFAKNGKGYSGSVELAWDGQVITGEGKIGYQGEKLSGEITLHLMERSQAEALEAAKKAPEGEAPKPAPAKGNAKPKHIDYVVFGEGDLNFAFNEWLNGSAHVIVDPKGYLTIIGKITPQKEFILFQQQNYNKQIFKLEARASYGLPVVGNLFIFANVGLDAFAKLGPGKFYNIVVEGTYSTDPTKAKDFSVRGSLNVSAVAGLTLRAEVGAGFEILSHDIKVGAGINGTVGIKGYAEATPTIGYREKATDGQDLKGEFYIRGDLEIAAQPFLGLSGDVFVDLSTPWWSPLSDKRWTWPLFSKEWPIGGSYGIGASLDYVFGSGQLPKLDFKPVEFNSDKFMTDMYDDKTSSGTGEREQKGKWNEKNAGATQAPPKVSPVGNGKPGKPPTSSAAKAKPPGSTKRGKPANPDARTADGKTVKQHQDEAAKKNKQGKKDKKSDERTDAQKIADLKAAVNEATLIARDERKSKRSKKRALLEIQKRYNLKSLEMVTDRSSKNKENVHVRGVINPTYDGDGFITSMFPPEPTVVIEAQIGPPQPRQDFENVLMLPGQAGLPGYQRAHLLGAGFGVESPLGVLYAPEEVNQALQNRGIEALIRGMYRTRYPGAEFFIRATAKPHIGTQLLARVVYEVFGQFPGEPQTKIFEFRISVDANTNNPTITPRQGYVDPEALSIYTPFIRQFIARRWRP